MAISTHYGRTITQLDADIQQRADQQPLTTRCALCPWEHAGTAAEGRTAAHTHRQEEHPDRVGKKRRRQANLGDPRATDGERDHAELVAVERREVYARARQRGLEAARQ